MSKKPQGLPEFESLLGKLAKVPKAQLDRQVERYKERKLAKKKRKS